jgi:hypothetical protein
VGEVTSDAPAVAFVRDSGQTVTVAAADPAQGNGVLHITISRALPLVSADPGVTVSTSATATTVAIPQTGGVTGRAVLGLAPVDAGVGPTPADGGGGGEAGANDAGANDAGAGDAAPGLAASGGPASGGCGCFVASRARPGVPAGTVGLLAAAIAVSWLRRARESKTPPDVRAKRLPFGGERAMRK